MSIALQNINLASAAVGQQFILDLTPVGQGTGAVSSYPSTLENKAHLVIHNESGCGILLTFDTGTASNNVPAGAWRTITLEPGTSKVFLLVTYFLSNPPVSLFMSEYFFPGEIVSETGILGNSPIGGTAATSSVQTLSNENNPPTPILVIDIGNTTVPQLITIFNDGSFILSILIGGVAHQLLKGQNAFHSLLLGNTSDVIENIGDVSFDKTIHVVGTSLFDNTMTLANSKYLQWKDTGGTARNAITLDNANNLGILADSGGGAGAKIYFIDGNGSQIAQMTSSGISLNEGAYGLLVGSMSRINGGVASCGSGTSISHGLGVLPDLISGTPVGSQPFSATVGIGNADASIFKATVGAGSQIDWTAIKG